MGNLYVKEVDGGVVMFDRRHLMAIPFGRKDLMVIQVADREGIELSEFEEILPDVGVEAPDAGLISKNLDLKTEQMNQDLYRTTLYSAGEEDDSSFNLMVTQVFCNADDTIRAVYVAKSLYPQLVVAVSQEQLYREMDPGAIICIVRGSIESVHRAMSKKLVTGLYPKWAAALEGKRRDKFSYLLTYKKQYLERYLGGELPDAFINIFKAEGNTLRYTDSVIEFHNREDTARALRAIITQDTNDYETLFMLMAEQFTNSEHGLSVNGVSVRHTTETRVNKALVDVTLNYINGKRIPKSDVEECIRRALCYPDGEEQYNTFLSEVSKVSLKFHKAVLRGIPVRLYEGDLAAMDRLSPTEDGFKGLFEAKSDGDIIQNGFNHYTWGNAFADTHMRTRKCKGKKSQVFLMDQWRTIANFDAFYSRASDPHRKGSRSLTHASMDGVFNHSYTYASRFDRGGGDEELSGSKVLSRACIHVLNIMVRLDAFLVPSDRMICGKLTRHNPESLIGGYNSSALSIPKSMQTYALSIVREFAKGFEDAFQDARDRLDRSRELLANVIEKTQTELRTVGDRTDYIVTGTSGNRYRIDGASHGVYDMTGAHICIVRAMVTDVVGFDYLCSLILALSQDKRTAKSIYTLEKHLGL